MSDRILDFAFQREKNVWVPANQTCMELAFPMQRAVYKRKWLEGHTSSAPQNTI